MLVLEFFESFWKPIFSPLLEGFAEAPALIPTGFDGPAFFGLCLSSSSE